MSDIKFYCSNCQQKIAAPPELTGQVVACPTCSCDLTVPGHPALATTDSNADSSRKRVTLSKKQLGDPVALQLLSLLKEIVDDGELSLGELDTLSHWLDAASSSQLPAIMYLAGVVREIQADGRINTEERCDLLEAIERVLPPEDRKLAKLKRKEAASISYSEDEVEDDVVPATDRQITYIIALGGIPSADLSIDEASQMIDHLKSNTPPSPRQMMVLRFWDKKELFKSSRTEVTAWMDQWYAENPYRQAAWELFKDESGDPGDLKDPSRVPVGIGPKYLQRVQPGKRGFFGRLFGS